MGLLARILDAWLARTRKWNKNARCARRLYAPCRARPRRSLAYHDVVSPGRVRCGTRDFPCGVDAICRPAPRIGAPSTPMPIAGRPALQLLLDAYARA